MVRFLDPEIVEKVDKSYIKNVWIWSVCLMSEIKKSLKFPMGGGQAYLGIFPQFFRFFLA